MDVDRAPLDKADLIQGLLPIFTNIMLMKKAMKLSRYGCVCIGYEESEYRLCLCWVLASKMKGGLVDGILDKFRIPLCIDEV